MEVKTGWCVSQALSWAHYDGEPYWIAFSRESGAVHLLNEAAYTLWTYIAAHPSSRIDQMLDALVGQQPESEESSSNVLEALRAMDRAGFIHPVWE